MSCKLRRLIVLFVLSTIALIHNCSTFSARSEREGYSGENSPITRVSSKPIVSADFPNRTRDENVPLQSSKVVYDLRSKKSEKTKRSSHKRASEREPGSQGDEPGFFRKTYRNGAPDMWMPSPMVHCSGEVMTLTAPGREFRHVFVDRVNAAPLPLFQIPTYCGYSVRINLKDLVLMAPYDGCYVRQENGSYVLPLHLWGSPFKISCPMTSVVSQPTPSVLCSQFGMVVATEGAREAADRHGVQVNGHVLPLLSETCAYRIRSPSEVVLLHVSFSSECVTLKDGKIILNIILDGKQFTLSCPLPYHLTSRRLPYIHSHRFPKPLQPSRQQVSLIPHVPPYQPVPGTVWQPEPLKPDSSKPAVTHQCPNDRPAVPQFPHISHHDTRPIHQTQEVQYPVMPNPHFPQYPISCPPYPERFCSKYPNLYPQPAMTTASPPPIQPMPWIPVSPPTIKPQIQETQFPQIPVFPPTPPAEPSKSSPSLVCSKNRLIVTLPSARMDSIKVKDVTKNTWMSITSVPEACNYTLHFRGDSVELSSPLPSCHTHKKSPTVITLHVRFWDSSQLQLRTLQLQCHFIGDGDAQPTAPPFKPLHQNVVCSSQNMSVKLPPGPISGVIVQTASDLMPLKPLPIVEAPSHCGYSVRRGDDGAINVILPYTSCHMRLEDGQYKIILKYQTTKGGTVETLLSCQSTFIQECNVPPEQQLVCGSVVSSSSECHDRGCCYSKHTHSCYYPMDECTLDRHFVFSVHSDVTEPPLSPATLVTAGNSPCTPHKVTADVAIFKIPLDECGVRRYEVGKTVIYMVEILNRKQPITLNYGTITRDSSVRLLVECRYLPGSVASVGYLVKSPSLGPSIKSQGVFGVQLRIAKDELYNSFHPQYHLPLRMLLGKPLYLEVRLLNPPDPTAKLLVHYCVVYPRSAKSAWILIYDGCPNVLDQTPAHKPPPTPAEALTNHVRRFTVSTFQFLSEDTSLHADEELYFMCSTEVCLPSDGPCVEGCFADPSMKI